MINKVILIGNLGGDPEVRTTANGNAVCNFTVATSQKVKDEEKTEWHRIVCWGKLADIAAQYLTKGSKVYLEGELRTSKWTDKEGHDRYTTEVHIGGYNSTMKMLSDKGTKSATAPSKDLPFDDDVPFDL